MTQPLRAAFVRPSMLAVALVGALLVAGCAPPRATSSGNELPFDEAVAQASEGLFTQTQKLPGFLARMEVLARAEQRLAKRSIVIDPMLDAASGQQTQATQRLERRVTELLKGRSEAFEFLPFQSENLARASHLLTGTMTRMKTAQGRTPLQINLALTDLKTGTVAAQASAVARDEGLDHTPLPYYQDSPVLVKDAVIEGYVRTTTTAPGQAADPTYRERVAVATVIQEAGSLYNAEKYPESLEKYRAAGGQPGGEQLRTLNGIYLNLVKLGRNAEAEQAFGNIVAFGLRHNKLDIKFLFNPGTTSFWSDPKVSGLYPMWLRQIAKESAAAKVCMQIVGHTSRTGSEQVNDALSLQRATFIQQRLAAEAAAVGQRSKPAGVGFRENIVGSGTDNAVDALDRRVEFRVEPC